jgi:hypothetical protein
MRQKENTSGKSSELRKDKFEAELEIFSLEIREQLPRNGYIHWIEPEIVDVPDANDATPKSMTLAEAVAILNKYRHHGSSAWLLGNSLNVLGPQAHRDIWLPFDVVAMAEKYERESK